jgi:hypothetical protein
MPVQKMKKSSIFGAGTAVVLGSFYKFKEEGEKVAGVFIGASQAPVRYDTNGKPFAVQTIIELDTTDYVDECDVRDGEEDKLGGILNVYINNTNRVLAALAKTAKPNDIIRLTFTEETEAKEGNEHGAYAIDLDVVPAEAIA